MTSRSWMRFGGVLTILVAVIALGAYAYTSMGIRHQDTVRIGIATWPGFATGMIGQKEGLFDGVNLEYHIIDDLNARHAAFKSGAVDVMISSVDLYVQEYQEGLQGKVFLITDESAGGDGIVVNSSIKTAADLKGKTVAFARATPSHYLLYKVLQRAGLTPSDIKQVKVEDPGTAGQAFLSGKVDAAVTWEPFLSKVRDSGKGRILATSRDFPGTIVDVLVASPALAAKPDLVKRIIEGWLKSVAWEKQHPDEGTKIMAAGLNIAPADASGILAGIKLADTARNRYFLCPSQGKPPAIDGVIHDAGTFWKQEGIISSVPAPNAITMDTLCTVQ